VRILADEQLNGAALEAVQTRIDLWTRTHIERLLAPLFTLAAAEDITGIARGIAYQIVEALGVLERSKVAAEMKALEQPNRAVLRKHGVRFGAYHLYVPALLKPAPRALAAQLWMLKSGAPDMKGLDDLQHLAASGRTSFPVDKDTPKPLYRTIGYRVCGERAVRVDILERLADLIRPALAWREGAPGEKPAGALDGRGFTVTGAMTSLAGSSGDDFASILRSLGYRMERRAKPAEPAAIDHPADAAGVKQEPGAAAPVEASAADSPQASECPTPTPAGVEAIADVEVTAVEAPVVPPASLTDTAASEGASAAADGESTAAPRAEASASEPTPTSDVAVASVDQPAAVASEPQLIEVWRIGRADERGRRPRRTRPPRRQGEERAMPAEGQPDAPPDASVAASGARRLAPAADAGRPAEGEREQRGRHGRPRGDRAEQSDRGERSRHQDRPARQDRKDRHERSDWRDHAEQRGRRERDRRDDDRPPRTWVSANERRGKEPDPNSPFAKLAALKAQLEADKERR